MPNQPRSRGWRGRGLGGTRSGSYLPWRCGGAAPGESAVAFAGGPLPALPALARRPRAPCSSLARSREPSGRLPVALGARRLQPGREQWSRSWCPGGGAGGVCGEGSRPPPGVSRSCGYPPLSNDGCLTLLADRAPSPCGDPWRRGVSDSQPGYGALCGAPLRPEGGEVLGSRLLFQLRRCARGREGEVAAMRLGRVSIPSGSGRPAPGTALGGGGGGSSARAAAGPAPGLPIARRQAAEAAAPVPAGALGALCAGEARGLSHSHRAGPTSSPPPSQPLPAGPCSSRASAPARELRPCALLFPAYSLTSLAPLSIRAPPGGRPRSTASAGREEVEAGAAPLRIGTWRLGFLPV